MSVPDPSPAPAEPDRTVDEFVARIKALAAGDRYLVLERLRETLCVYCGSDRSTRKCSCQDDSWPYD